ncbi:MAG: GNAT family N-acetyltransferase [Bacteroidota bacterium]
MNIRIATVADAALIAEISRETFVETFAEYNTPRDVELFLTKQFSKEILMAQVGEKNHVFFLAFENEELAGYIFLKQHADANTGASSPIEISRLYARTKFIGKGIGKSLMQTAIHHAKSCGNDCIWLGVWEKNLRGIRFYTSFGYEKFGEHDFLLGEDIQLDWLMRLHL